MSFQSHTKQKPLLKHFNIALVGIGHRGYNTYFVSMASSRFASIIAVCDTSENALAAFRVKHPEIPAYTSLVKLLENHTPDFAIVSVPHKYHVECVSQLSAAGIPVLKEKPVVNSFEEFEMLMKLPVKIGVTFQKRFEPRFMQFQKLLQSIGKITSIRANLMMNIKDLDSTWRAEDNVGVTVSLLFHLFWTQLSVSNICLGGPRLSCTRPYCLALWRAIDCHSTENTWCTSFSAIWR